MTEENAFRSAAKMLPGRWMKGNLSDEHGNRCGLGHLKNALIFQRGTYRECWVQMTQLLNRIALEQYPERCGSDRRIVFIAFNDHRDTTEEDVVAVFEKAATEWDGRVQESA